MTISEHRRCLDIVPIFPDEHGILNLIDLNPPDLTAQDIEELEVNLEKILFRLYTRANPGGEKLTIGDVEQLKNSNFDPANPTRFVFHGWRGDGEVESCTMVVEAFLDVGEYNVIVVDWGAIAKNLFYGKVVRSTPDVSKHVAKMIDFMNEEGKMDLSKTKLIGFSLGAHVAGLSGYHATGKIAAIVALDPAKPMYNGAGIDKRVDAVDAEHVQVIHTCAGSLGLAEPIGTSDFYPNDGKKQPGCRFDFFGICAHSRAYHYYVESIRNPTGFVSILNSNEQLAKGNIAYMGGPMVDLSAQGSYVLETNAEAPYALG